MGDKYIVFTAWPYSNGDLHIGHIAGAYLPPDILARYLRLRGYELIMASGSDTHGTPITVRAEEEGITPRQVVDHYHPRFLEAFQKLGITFDLFTETDTENHWHVAQQMFLRLLENGYLYKDVQTSFYCENCDRFLADRYVEGICPHCGYDGARGDQCDNCKRTLDALELIEPRCKVCGRRPVPRETEHYFLDLARLNRPILAWVRTDKEHWRPNVLNFTLAQLESGELRGRPVTRDIGWGISVPLEGFEHKTIYVWMEAVTGYLSVIHEWARNKGDPELWRAWWQNPSVRHYNFIGKDNIPFHTIIWPGMLIGHGGLTLPYDVPSNEYLNVEGRKLSKSRRWVVEVLDFLSRYDPDPLRYILTINAPEAQDTNFSWEEFVRRNNDELVATWGNLANRMLKFAYKNFDGRVPVPGELTPADRELLDRIEAAFEPVGDLIHACKFKAALSEVMALAHEANRYLDEQAPWFQIKEGRESAATTTYTTLRAIDSLKTLFLPFLPFSGQSLHRMLGYETDIFGHQYVETIQEETKTHLALGYEPPADSHGWKPSELPPGQPLGEPAPLFKKLDDKIVDEEVARMTKGEGPGGQKT
jgi:methionyl-tRNA synthetase